MAADGREKCVKVVVLGDIGRSPRMQYHALSLANNGLRVQIIGYVDSPPLEEILENPKISISKLHPLVFNRGPKLLQYGLKAFWQAVSLLLTLFITGSCDIVLCQNPPAIPTLPICRFYCLVTRTKFIIDWHNYAYSIMALSLPAGCILLKVAQAIERYFAQTSDHNFCVTKAMKADLLLNWNIFSKVLYDRPPKIFHPLTLEEKHNWYHKFSQQCFEFGFNARDNLNQAMGDSVNTAFTQVVGNSIMLRQDRPGLLFSSTSWTPDEDFSVLFEALEAYENEYSSRNLPKLICVITGKGPMKEHYTSLIASKKWQNVKVITPWLEACDYPSMVGSADLGVCLHTSSSGLDLPMKVVDMFGAGLPVCAFDFKCLDELVVNGINGYTFTNSKELSEHIFSWFENFPTNSRQNIKAAEMRDNIGEFQKSRWEGNWNLRVRQFFQ